MAAASLATITPLCDTDDPIVINCVFRLMVKFTLEGGAGALLPPPSEDFEQAAAKQAVQATATGAVRVPKNSLLFMVFFVGYSF